jgi:hypothetical protein
MAPIAVADEGIALSPMSQQNAVQKADQYLSLSAFSRQGLISQLEYDEFSTEDATFAVDSITVDWNVQAVKKAKNYLSLSALSRGGLIDQLEYDGFTPAQAAYGVAGTGL